MERESIEITGEMLSRAEKEEVVDVYKRQAQGIVRVFLVQPVILVQNGDARRLNRRNAAEQIPQTLKMVLYLTSAAHHISCLLYTSSCILYGLYRAYYYYLHNCTFI